jgi:VRR-NUC domain
MIISSRAPRQHLELDEQVKCIDYLELLKLQKNDILYSATAQSTFTRSWSQVATNKKAGVKKGLPDLIIIVNKILVFIELKKPKGGVVSPEQKEWIDKLNLAGEYAFVCHGFEQFKKIIDQTVKISKAI